MAASAVAIHRLRLGALELAPHGEPDRIAHAGTIERDTSNPVFCGGQDVWSRSHAFLVKFNHLPTR